MEANIDIRPATSADLSQVAPLAGELVRLHHRWDEKRFLLIEPVEDGYRWFFGQQLEDKDTVILVAAKGEQIVGYLYGSLEGRDWNALREAGGAVHDIYVHPSARRSGVAKALMQRGLAELKARGAKQVVLLSASQNVEGQALFKSLGYRPTMVEMTIDL